MKRTPIEPGTRFGLLTYLHDFESLITSSGVRRMILMRCDCGDLTVKEWNCVKKGSTRTCGAGHHRKKTA